MRSITLFTAANFAIAAAQSTDDATAATENSYAVELMVLAALVFFLALVLKFLMFLADSALTSPLFKAKMDRFHKENQYSWDYTFVFEVFDEGTKPSPMQQRHSLKALVTKFRAAGLETNLFYSVQRDEVSDRSPFANADHLILVVSFSFTVSALFGSKFHQKSLNGS